MIRQGPGSTDGLLGGPGVPDGMELVDQGWSTFLRRETVSVLSEAVGCSTDATTQGSQWGGGQARVYSSASQGLGGHQTTEVA